MSNIVERDDIGKLPLTLADRKYYNRHDNNAPGKVNDYIASMASHGGVPNGGRGFPTPDVGKREGGGIASGSHGAIMGRSKTLAQRRGSPWVRHMGHKLVDSLLT